MSDIQHIDVDSDEFIDAPKALRDHVKKLQQVNTRLSETNADLSGRVTAVALTDVLKEFKNPERVKRDLLSDKVDPLNTEAVNQWLSQNGSDYAKGEGAPSSQSQTPAAPVATPEEVQAHQRLAAGQEFTAEAAMSKLEAAQAEITPEMTGTQIEAIYRKHGV
jgi:hypothetical protein